MTPVVPTTESELVEAVVEMLTRLLPSSWGLQAQAVGEDPEALDLLIKGPGNSGQYSVFVEAKFDVSPRDVEALMGGSWRRWRRRMGNQPILLVAPYIGPRVRELLIEENVSYADLTGNVRVSLDYPAVFIATQGATRDPRSVKPRTSGIKGAKAGDVVRVLVDAAPPYTAAEIARAAKVNEGYLSRILDTLVDEGLIDRESFGPITRVDWPAMLRRRAQVLDLFSPAVTLRYVARRGPTVVLEELRDMPPSERPPTVTGSFAASRLAPVAAPTLLVVYSMSPRQVESQLELLPAEVGADTVLIRPDSYTPFSRARSEGGIAWAAPSQVVIDCLAGSGRMPSEGEALISWMMADESRWRYPSIKALLDADQPKEA